MKTEVNSARGGMSEEKQATPAAELFRRLSSPSEPKTELEHFAWRLYWDCAEENTRLKAENADLRKDAERLREENHDLKYSICEWRADFVEMKKDYDALREDAERWRKHSPELIAALQDVVDRNEIQNWFNVDKQKAAIDAARRGDE